MRAASPRPPAVAAALLVLASAVVTAYWLAGGTFALDTVGGEVERLARERSASTLAGLGLTLVLMLIAAGLALALARPARRRAVVNLALSPEEWSSSCTAASS